MSPMTNCNGKKDLKTISEEYQQAIRDPITLEDLPKFKEAYEEVKHLGKYKTFRWRGRKLLIGFAEYVILHLEAQLKYQGKGKKNNDSPQ